MISDQREIRRKLRTLQHGERIIDVCKTCRYFGSARASFYPWRISYRDRDEADRVNTSGLVNGAEQARLGTGSGLRRRGGHSPS